MADLRFHPEADAEYLEAVHWYRAISLRVAFRFVLALESAVAKIRAMPKAYPRYNRQHRMFVLKRFPYYLVYREQADDITIVAVAHKARRPGYWKSRSRR